MPTARLVRTAALAALIAAGLSAALSGSPAHAIAAQPGRSTAAKAAPAAPVDVNTATPSDLTTVPGIGKVLAQRIVEFREKNGPFGRIDDLVKVKGIGEKSLERIRPYVTASAPKAK